MLGECTTSHSNYTVHLGCTIGAWLNYIAISLLVIPCMLFTTNTQCSTVENPTMNKLELHWQSLGK